MSFSEAVKQHPDLVKKYLGKVVPYTDNFFAALNSAISQMMIFVNACYKTGSCPKEYAEGFVKMLSCICPHIGEEIYAILGHEGTIAYEPWPTFDEAKTKEDTIEIAVQVNGKVRGKVFVTLDEDENAVFDKVMESEAARFISGMQIVKKIYVKGKIFNIVVKP